MRSKAYYFAVLFGIVGLIFFILSRFLIPDYSAQLKKLDRIITKDLSRYGVKEDNLTHRLFQKKQVDQAKEIDYLLKEFDVPPAFPLKKYEQHLNKILAGAGYVIKESRIKKEGTELVLTLLINFRKYNIYSLSLHQAIIPSPVALYPESIVYPPGSGKVAIVIDDWGYNLTNLQRLWEIERPITLAVLPKNYTKLKYSTQIAKTATEKKYEVILHLPLEPKEYQGDDNRGFITTEMKEEKVIALLDTALKSVPYAKGVSNHQGSKATEDYQLMKTILTRISQRRLYYLDSVTGENSVCPAIAEELKLKFARRDIFLDNSGEKDYIKNQLRQLAALALKKGQAIGIGHDRRLTLEAIKEILPELEEAGIKFVFLSELVE